MTAPLTKTQKILLVGLAALVLLAGFTVALRFTLFSAPLGADFYTFWLAGRSVFVQGENPYSAEVTLQSQLGIYGRPALPQEDQVAFAYPPYSLLPILPAAFLPYDWAEAYWLSLNILALSALMLAAFPRGKKRITLLYFLFYPVFFGLILGNFAVPLGTILVFCLVFVFLKDPPGRGWQVAAGLMMAWATCKPQFVWFFGLVMLLIALRQRLWPFLISLMVGGVSLAAISFLLVPNWLVKWIGRIFEYAGYVQSRLTLTTLLAQVLPDNTALTLTYILAAGLGGLSFYLILRWYRGHLPTLHMFAWAGFCTYLLHPHGIAYEQISFLAPLLVWAGNQQSLRSPARWLAWPGAMLFSWVCFGLGKWLYHPVDTWPVIWNGLFLAWLLTRPTETLTQTEVAHAN